MAGVQQQADSKPELGVLFVHGIGQQRPGQTLVKFADPLSRWLARWLSDGGHTEADVERADGAHVVVAGAVLAGDEPAHLLLSVEAGTNLTPGGGQRWLLAESCWAEAFEPPKTTSLLMWMLLILPYVLLVQTYEKLRRAHRQPRQGGWGWLARVARTLAFGLVYVSALPLAALGAVVIGLLLVGLVVPIPQIGDRAKQAALLLSNTIGDSFVLTSSAVQFDAMVARVDADLRWLAGSVQRVAVVAHSQGSAVSYSAITGSEPPENLWAFVTLGEAIKKLQLVRGLQSYGAARPASPVGVRPNVVRGLIRSLGRWFRLKSLRFGFGWVGLVGIFLLSYAVPQLVVAVTQQTTHLARASALTGLGVLTSAGALLLCAHFWSEDFEHEPPAVETHGRRVRWADFYASADPVPNGPLFRHLADKPWLSETEVWNYASILRDHTSYTKREDDFLSDLVRELFAASGRPVPAETAALLRRGRWRSWWRVWWLTFARSLAAAAAIATIYRLWGHLEAIGHRVIGWPHWWHPLRWIGHRVLVAIRNLIIVGHPQHAEIVGGLAVLAVIAGGYMLLAAIWAYWQRQDAKRFYRHTSVAADTDPLGGRELLWFLLTLGVLTFAGIVACISGDYATSWNWAARHRYLSLMGLAGLVFAPIVLAWLLRERLRSLETVLMRLFAREPDVPAPLGDAGTVAAPPVTAG